MLITPARARARVSRGGWLADCPAGCNSAMLLQPKQSTFLCGMYDPSSGRIVGGCGATAEVEWPADAVWIWDALLERPNPENRNWFPSGHELAIRSGLPHGQTPAQLRAETAEHQGER